MGLQSKAFTPLIRRTSCRSNGFWRGYATKGQSDVTAPHSGSSKLDAKEIALSSCPENTILAGLNYLKNQPAVQALKDDEYPSWLWSLLSPRNYPNDGPGSVSAKKKLREANRERIRERNFLKTQ